MVKGVMWRIGRWLARRKLSGRFWQVLLIIWLVNSIAAVSMNLAAYLLLWPNAIADEWQTMIALPLIMVTVLTVPVIYLDYALVMALLESRRELEEEAHRDFLTGVSNRRGFLTRLEQTTQMSGALLLLDLDSFKQVNDRFGHDTGDEVLAKVGRALRKGTRRSDLVARMGGEEFAVFMPLVSRKQALDIAERVRACISDLTATCLPGDAVLTCSGGLIMSKPGQRFTQLYSAADNALYRAKDNGRDQIVVAAPCPVQQFSEPTSRAG